MSPNLESVAAIIVPLVDRFSFPKSIPFPSAPIELSEIVTLPNEEPVAPLTVPLVEMLLVPMFILPPSLTIEPFDIVISPNLPLVEAVIVPDVAKELSENDIAFVEEVIALPLTLIFPISAVPFTSR